MIDYLETEQQQQLIQLDEPMTQFGVQPNFNLIQHHQQQQQQQQLQQQQHHQFQPRAQPQSQTQNSQSSQNNELIGYYFGSISRDTAEWILKNHGNNLDGSYLLRSSGPNDDFVLSLLVVNKTNTNESSPATTQSSPVSNQMTNQVASRSTNLDNNNGQPIEVLHYKIVETEDSFVALHGQIGNEKFATIDELIDKAQGVATRPRWPVLRHSLEHQILPPTYWGLTVDQVRLAILLKAKQWGFPLLTSFFHQASNNNNRSQPLDESQQKDFVVQHQQALQMNKIPMISHIQNINAINNNNNNNNNNNVNNLLTTTLNNETIRTLIYKSLHEFQPWFHGKISREEAEQRIEENKPKDGYFLVRERDNFSYAMCISHKKMPKHYRIDVLPTGELAIQDGRKFTSLMALVSHYTIMSDGLWCALTEACIRPLTIIKSSSFNHHGTQLVSSALDNSTPCPGAVFMSAQNNIQLDNANQNGNFLALMQRQQQKMLSSTTNNKYIPTNDNQGLKQNIYCTAASMVNGGLNTNRVAMANNQLTNGKPSNNNTIARHHHQHHNHQSRDSANQPHSMDHKNSGTNHNSLVPVHGHLSFGLRTPIKEWLQTINNKWSQLINAKGQHQSLNSFLFGNQNPLNHNFRHHNKRHNQTGHHNSHQHQHHHHRSSMAMDGPHSLKSCCKGQYSVKSSPLGVGSCPNRAALQQTEPMKARCCALQTPNHRDGPQQAHGLTMSAKTQSNSNALATPVQNSNCSNCDCYQHNHHDLLYNNKNIISCSANGSEPHRTEQAANVLDSLPLMSAFNSQSFIGSPLFAVNINNHTDNKQLSMMAANRANNNMVNVLNNNSMEPERLISPAHSNCEINNNPYVSSPNQPAARLMGGGDLYGSQTSTGPVTDHQTGHQSTSTSSSSGPASGSGNLIQAQNNNINQSNKEVNAVIDELKLQQEKLAFGFNNFKPGAETINSDFSSATKTGPIGATGRPFLTCGQHAGSAYRYTNCPNDENSLRLCTHTTANQTLRTRYNNDTNHILVSNQMGQQRMIPRAADDTQVNHRATKLLGPAAMTKFVQFQDGQCLRTHRDARSIQMAYLSAVKASNEQQANRQALQEVYRQQANSNFGRINNNSHSQHKQRISANNNDINNQATQIDLMSSGTQGYGTQLRAVTSCNLNNGTMQRIINNENLKMKRNSDSDRKGKYQMSKNPSYDANDIDLIDCEVNGNGFQFKYDPKLIKSSSIETLCELDQGEQEESIPFEQYKTNTDLLMSLQSCLFPKLNTQNTQENGKHNTFESSSILNPIPVDYMLFTNSSTSCCDQLSAETTANSQQIGQHHESELSNEAKTIGIDENNNALIIGNQMGSVTNQSNQKKFDFSLENMNKQHNLDDLTTNLLSELTDSLKTQVYMKNRQSGLMPANHLGGNSSNQHQNQGQANQNHYPHLQHPHQR